MLQPFKAVWAKSWTSIWGWSKIVIGSIAALIPSIVNVTQDSNVRQEIEKLNLKYLGLTLAILGAVTLMSMSHKDANAA